MRELRIPTLTPLKMLEKYSPDASHPSNAPPIPDYLWYFEVPGVANEQVAQVLTELIVRRLVERARKVALPRQTIAKPGASSVIAWAVIGSAMCALIAMIVEGLAVPSLFSLDTGALQAGGVVGAALGLAYGWWRRARLVTAYNGLALVSADPGEPLHRNYWLPIALRQLCSPKPTISLQA